MEEHFRVRPKSKIPIQFLTIWLAHIIQECKPVLFHSAFYMLQCVPLLHKTHWGICLWSKCELTEFTLLSMIKLKEN